MLLNKQTRQILGKVRIHYEQEETTYPPHAYNWAWLPLTGGKQAAWVPGGTVIKIAAGSIKFIQTGVKANTTANREPQRRLGRCAKQTAGDCLDPRQIFSPFIVKPPIHCQMPPLSLEGTKHGIFQLFSPLLLWRSDTKAILLLFAYTHTFFDMTLFMLSVFRQAESSCS